MCLPPLSKGPIADQGSGVNPSTAPIDMPPSQHPAMAKSRPMPLVFSPGVYAAMSGNPVEFSFSPLTKSPALPFIFSPFQKSPAMDLDFSWLSEYQSLSSPTVVAAPTTFINELQETLAPSAEASTQVTTAVGTGMHRVLKAGDVALESSPSPLPASISASSSGSAVPSAHSIGSGSTHSDSPHESHTMSKKQRKRKLASDLAPHELSKMREVNRIAAQRHRCLAKMKQAEQEHRISIIGQRNDELRKEVQCVTAELNTLKRLVMSVYGPGGARSGYLPFLSG